MAERAQYAPSPTAAALVIAAVVAVGVALYSGALLAHLIAAILIAFLCVSFALAVRSLRDLTVTRTVQPTAYDGDGVMVSFTLHNTGKGQRSLVEIKSAFYSPLAPSGTVSALVADVQPSGSSTVSGQVPDLRRGEYLFSPPSISSGDPFGLFTATRRMHETVVPTARLTVFPRTFPIDYLAIASDLSWSISGLEPTNQAGASGDFLGTREYRPGDSVRAIHWPLSARIGDLIVKEFERNASTEVSIFLDLDHNAAWGRGREHTLEYAVRIAASVAEYASRRGNAVQLVAYGTHWAVLPPGKGAYHQQMLMHYLAAFAPVGSTPFNFVIGQMAPRLKEGASAVIVFPSEHLHLELFGPALEGLWARRIRVTAIIMNVESFLDGRAKGPPADMPAASYLASRGASVYLVSCGADLSRQLSAPLEESSILEIAMNQDRAIKPYSSLPEPFVLLSIIVWIDLLAAVWPHVNPFEFGLRAVAYGVLAGVAASHTWFFARRSLWSNASHLVVVSAAWVVLLVGLVLWLEWDSPAAIIGWLAFLQLVQCSFLFNHVTLRLAHLVSFVVMLSVTPRLPLVGGGAAWLAFAVLSMLVLAYDRTAQKAGPTGYDNGERRLMPERLALVSSVVLLAAMLFFLTPMLRWPDMPNLKRPRTPPPPPQSVESLPPDQFGLGGSTSCPSPDDARLEIMRVETQPRVSGPLYLRGQAFDTFDGESWSNVATRSRSIPLAGSEWADLMLPEPAAIPIERSSMRQSFEMLVNMPEVLFTACRPTRVEFPQGGVSQVLVGTTDRSIRVDGTLRRGSRYVVDGVQEVFSNVSFVNASFTGQGDYTNADLRIPEGVDPRVRRMAETLTAAYDTNYDKAVAIERYLRGNYMYSLSHDVRGPQVVNDFLLRARRGHCALFASAMVVMAREVGVPARYVTGFLAQDGRNGVFTVRGTDGHAWVEIYVPSAGWLAFDPTGSQIDPADQQTKAAVARDDGQRDVRATDTARNGGGLYGRGTRDEAPGDDRSSGSGGGEIARNGDGGVEGPGGTPVSGGSDGPGMPNRSGGAAGGADGPTASEPVAGGSERGGASAGTTQNGTGDRTVIAPGGGTSLPKTDRPSSTPSPDPVAGSAERPQNTVQKPAERHVDPPPPDPEQVASDWRLLVFALLGVGLVGLAGFFIWHRGVRRIAERREIRRALPLSIDEDDPDPRRFIVKVYHTMVAGLGRAGYPKHAHETPREYAAAVGDRDAGLGGPVAEMTELFHLARYGDIAVTPSDAAAARSVWQRIVGVVKKKSSQ